MNMPFCYSSPLDQQTVCRNSADGTKAAALLLGRVGRVLYKESFCDLIRSIIDAMFAHARLFPPDLIDTVVLPTTSLGSGSKPRCDGTSLTQSLRQSASLVSSWVQRVKSETDVPFCRELKV